MSEDEMSDRKPDVGAGMDRNSSPECTTQNSDDGDGGRSPVARGRDKARKSRSHSRSRSRSHSNSKRRRRSYSRSYSRSCSQSPRRRHHRHRHRCHHYHSYSRSRSRSYSPHSSRRRHHRRKHHRSKSNSRSRSPLSNRKRHDGNRFNPSPSDVLGVFGLSLYTSEKDLKEIFGRYGELKHVNIVYDHLTGRSRGFGFVYFDDAEDAADAKENCNGLELDGRRIRVDFSITKRAHTPTPGVYMGRPTRPHDDERVDRDDRYDDRSYERSGYDRGYDREYGRGGNPYIDY